MEIALRSTAAVSLASMLAPGVIRSAVRPLKSGRRLDGPLQLLSAGASLGFIAVAITSIDSILIWRFAAGQRASRQNADHDGQGCPSIQRRVAVHACSPAQDNSIPEFAPSGEVSMAGWVAGCCMSDLRPARRWHLRRSVLLWVSRRRSAATGRRRQPCSLRH